MRVLTEPKTVNGEDYSPGQPDPEFVLEIPYIEIAEIGQRVYYSVHQDYTDEILTPTEQNDYVIETELDGNFTFTVLENYPVIKERCTNDPSYAEWLGLPAFDPGIHKTDLRNDAIVDKETQAKTDEWDKENPIPADGLPTSELIKPIIEEQLTENLVIQETKVETGSIQ